MERVAIDATVPMFALAETSPHRDACRSLIQAAATEGIRLEASVSIVQELSHVRSHLTGRRDEAARQAGRLMDLIICHPVEPPDIERALVLFAAHPQFDMVVALHAATALNRGILRMITADRAFDDVPQLQPISPADALELIT